MKDQMLIDKYNELGKAHVETVNQLAKKDGIIKERDKLIKEAMPYIEYLSKGRLYSNHLVDVWLEKAKKLIGDKGKGNA